MSPGVTATPRPPAARRTLVALAEPLRRIVAARVPSRHQVDDIVQETLARLFAARERVASDALMAYAVVTAHNLIASRGRRDATSRRNLPRLVDRDAPPQPEEIALRTEEASALRVALAALPASERAALVAHEVHGVDTATLARAHASTPGAVAARLARARARLRVEHLLAFRRVHLPTVRCRPVLLALSAGDLRRQDALDAGGHLLRCQACGELGEPLLTRTRVLTGLLPAPVAAWFAGGPTGTSRGRVSAAVVAVAVAVAVAVGLGWLVVAPDDSPSAARRSSAYGGAAGTVASPVGAGAPLEFGPARSGPTGPAVLEAARSDRQVQVLGARVSAVPADEGLWIAARGQRLWLQLLGPGESPVRLRPGLHVDLEAAAVTHGTGFARSHGVDDPAASRLDRRGVHLEVAAAEVRVRRPAG